MWTLFALLAPALALGVLLALAPALGLGAHVPSLAAPQSWPTELWILAISGTAATAAGLLDWRFHRRGGRPVGREEHRAELLALALGIPLFALLAVASVARDPAPLLAPIVALALVMAAAIAYDETRFHRACKRYETALHRVLVGGNGIAFLAWLNWCYAGGPRG
jgi:drug/metabolite transporter (DMT)-like permease